MCGVVALFEKFKLPVHENQMRETSLEQHMEMRGVDFTSSKRCSSEVGSLLLMHSRLQIVGDEIDGAQPIHDADNYFLTFNGEIYNYRELDGKYLGEGYSSDARVLFELLKKFGVSQVLEIIEGPFAFVFVDLKKNVMSAARDPVGEKPLFFSTSDHRSVFASTAKGCLIALGKPGIINNSAVKAYYSLGYVPSTMCLFEDVEKIGVGETWHFDLATHKVKVVGKKKRSYFFNKLTMDTFCDELSAAITQASDVDQHVGCFLSGGVDSNLIFQILRKNSNFESAYTFQYEDITTMDLDDAKEIAKNAGANLDIVHINREMVDEALYEILNRFDEPYSDYSAIPAHFIFDAAGKKGTKVLFGGDGADELFYGYTRYRRVYKLCADSAKLFDLMLLGIRLLMNALPDTLRKRFVPPRWRKIYSAKNFTDFYFKSLALFDCFDGFAAWQETIPSKSSVLKRMSILDQKFYLEGDILPKMDRLSLPFGVEGRLPFLNPRIISFADQLGYGQKVGCFLQTKPFLRSILATTQGDKALSRPKTGFGFPIANYIRSSNFFQSRYKELLSFPSNNSPVSCEDAQKLFDELMAGNDDLGDRVFLDFVGRHKLKEFS